MKIGYDGKRAVRNMTGLGNYSRLVIESVGESYPQHNLSIYTPDMRDNPRLQIINSLNNIEFLLPDKKEQRFGKSMWRSWGISRRLKSDGIDIYHGLSNELPLNIHKYGVRSVVTIHDVIYRRLPYCYKSIDRKIYDFKYGRSCKIADKIIAVSECTKKDIIEYYDIADDKIDVVYQGCDKSFFKQCNTDRLNKIRQHYHLPEQYILQVGTIERRKNAELTIKALAGVNKDIKLVLVGKGGAYLEEVKRIAEQERVSDRIIFLHDVPFIDLPGINQAAEVIVYPSHYEGFGIPILEGLASRRPVIAATGSCLEEAGGKNSIYVNPHNPKQLSDALNAVINNDVDKEYMINSGLKHANKFDNDNMADKIMSVYERVLQKGC